MSDGEYSREYADLVAQLWAEGDEELKHIIPPDPKDGATWGTVGHHRAHLVKKLAAQLDATIRTANETIAKLRAAHPLPTLEERVKAALFGIDRQKDEPCGWWNDSVGQSFGIGRLSAVLTAIRTTEPYQHGDIIRSGGTRFVLEDIGPDDAQPDNSGDES